MDELLALFTGTRIIRIDVKKDLRYFSSTMNKNRRATDETENFYSVKDFAQKTPTDMVKKFDQIQQEELRNQKDMYIRIKDLELLDLSEDKIYDIMKNTGTSKKIINNLLDGVFTPIPYSTPRFETKVRLVEEQMDRLTEGKGKYIYSANEDFLFPQDELDEVMDAYSDVEFFPETYNEETQQLEGGYYPDRENYQVDKEGRLIYDENGKPMLEEGFIKRQIKKIPGAIKDLVLPGAPKTGLQSKIQTPPLGDTPMPSKQLSQAQNVDPITRLTSTETALLSPTEKVIASRT
jgi:hypothetical protein